MNQSTNVMSTQREKQYSFGLKRIRELLKLYRFEDIRAKRTALEDWSVQFAQSYIDRNRNTPKWDELPWVRVSELEKDYPGIWLVFRERICLQSTISQAEIGDIIDSKGNNTTRTKSGPSGTSRRPHRPSRAKVRRIIPGGVANLKQEEGIAPLEADDRNIDLTAVPSPQGSIHQGDWLQDDWNDGVRGQSRLADADDAGAVDLTLVDIVDLTQDVVIDLTTEDPPEGAQPARVSAPGGQESEAQALDSSDNDSLFDGPEPGLIGGEVRPNDDDMLWHLSNTSEVTSLDTIHTSRHEPHILTSAPPVIKKGRKRALDFDDEASSPLLERPVQRLSKKRVISGTLNMPSLLTAVKGRVVERGRDGEYRSFNAHSSAGSTLAARMARYPKANKGDPSALGSIHLSDNTVDRHPITDPDELEDYEDEEEVLTQRIKSPTPDPEILALRDKWNQVGKSENPYDLISHLVNVTPSLPAPPPNAPPLFLLRISKDKTLRLMARNPSACRPQWYLSGSDIKSEEQPHTLERNSSQPPPSTRAWKQHKEHLLTLLPEFHDLSWRASLARREELQRAIDRAELRRDKQGAAELGEKMKVALASTWRQGEREQTKVIPRIGDIKDAETILFDVWDVGGVVRLEDPQARAVGGWAELVLYQHAMEVVGREERGVYEGLARMLEKKEKFLVISYSLVDEHHKNPHTLLVFASKSRKIGELCGLPEDMMRTRRSLVVVHIGRSVPTERLPPFEG